MRKVTLFILALALSAISHAQTLTVLTLNCGIAGTAINCNGVGLHNADGTSAGTVWIDDSQSTGYGTAHFLDFVGPLGNAAVDTTTPTGQVPTAVITFHGIDALGAAYTGEADLAFSYYTDSLRRVHRLLTGGTITIHSASGLRSMDNSPTAPTPTQCPDCPCPKWICWPK